MENKEINDFFVDKIRDIKKVEGFYYITFGNYEVGFIIPNDDNKLLKRIWNRSIIASSGWGDCSLFTHETWIRSYSFNRRTVSYTRKKESLHNYLFTFVVDNSNSLSHNINIDYPSFGIFAKTKLEAIRVFKLSDWEFKNKKIIKIDIF